MTVAKFDNSVVTFVIINDYCVLQTRSMLCITIGYCSMYCTGGTFVLFPCVINWVIFLLIIIKWLLIPFYTKLHSVWPVGLEFLNIYNPSKTVLGLSSKGGLPDRPVFTNFCIQIVVIPIGYGANFWPYTLYNCQIVHRFEIGTLKQEGAHIFE